ncbi:hypothetical protein DdX_18853 [Ditylenchus destructor]|uniref:Uncharacterized protein n=1 Tax=Ditylenchus destructor TaxID=166010 RepID=A0AAD4MKS4_9BILA|nr:hypothetical protein DdX_18853 [Ditylenchus destructor]
MSDPKIIDNPMFEKDSDSLQSEQFYSIENQRLIGPDTDPVKNFAQEYARRFYALKIVNWAFLLITAIVTTIGALYWLDISRWSFWYMKTPRIGRDRIYGPLVPEETLAALAWGMFLLATFSLAIYCWKKKTVEKSKIFLCTLAVTDICLSFYFFLNLLFVFVSYALRATSEYLWFYPRLMNDSAIEELTELNSGKGNSDYYKPYPTRQYWDHTRQYTANGYAGTPPPSSTFSPYQVLEMGTRKRVIIARLFLDPTVVIIALLAMLVNIVYVLRLRKTIKRNNLWAGNYRETYPESSKLSIFYAEWSKILNWVIPIFLILAPIYRITGFSDLTALRYYQTAMGICFGVCFYQWISYVQKVKFRRGDLSPEEHEKNITKVIKQDLVFCCIGAVFYLVLSNIKFWRPMLIQIVFFAAIIIFLCCIANNLYMLYKHGGLFEGLNLNGLPRISINVSINVIKDSGAIAGQVIGKNGNENEEKKTQPEEKKTDKNLCASV